MAASMEVIHGKRVAWPASIGLITGPQPLDQAHKRRDMRRGPLGGLSVVSMASVFDPCGTACPHA